MTNGNLECLETYSESILERLRKDNIEANSKIFKEIFPDGILLNKENFTQVTVRKRKSVSNSDKFVVHRHSIERSCKRKRIDCNDDEEHNDKENKSALIRFSWNKKVSKNLFTKSEAYLHGFEDTYSDDDLKDVKPNKFLSKNRPFEDVKEEDLVLVAERTSDKNYDSVNGTSCHQCRQKTDDLKTVCRRKECIGIRGQFCGPCLKNRYGECAKAAIMNPEWICPPCRSICNCSFCMKKKGKRATGILIHIAKQNGFDDVKSFLGD
ncbi:cell division cycle-associated protein 7 [Hydra vulgaris]|uniref:cell division cycle-associated protein 7 n=1 Tax=Hydra vulgaris TaxID=6087 RepID=UPI001F5F2F11|nr:cell division cycle-associated protein 7 [Hydra vulgaris]